VSLPLLVLLSALAFVAFTYAVYPLLLLAWGRRRPDPRPAADPETWPRISITVPVYNEAAQLRDTIESLLRIDYPVDKRQILIVSDASTDGTDEIVAGYRDRGVELVRMPERVGKTAAENAARPHLTGDLVINTDASIRIDPAAIKALVREFTDGRVGVASGRDISVGGTGDAANSTESGYVGYEMWVRSLETRAAGIVGSSGCLYAIRRELHGAFLPPGLSRDFASALIARENGMRAVSVDDAVCVVPRTASLRREFRRKVRTMVRGMQTLHYKRHLLNPFRHGRFAVMLFSHKVCRWLVPWVLVLGLLALLVLSLTSAVARVLALVILVGLLVALAAWLWPEARPMPRWIALAGGVTAANVAALVALVRAARGQLDQVWEPTRRDSIGARPATRPTVRK
jgi:cellulose synthase/poly-beta-1,6-N-acetylglucosamine synthase-like glycosyltransferase